MFYHVKRLDKVIYTQYLQFIYLLWNYIFTDKGINAEHSSEHQQLVRGKID